MAKYLDSNGLLYLWSKIKGIIPKKTSELTNDSGYITTADIPESAAASTTEPKMDGATAAVGTELAFARGDHVHPKDTSKVDKVDGKCLSSNDYTDDEKTKLAGIAEGANNYTLPDASSTTKGGVKVGANIDVASGTISVKNGSASQKGVVQLTDTVSADSSKAATPAAVKSVKDIAEGKQSPQTTLAGYGITDAYTKTEVDGLVSSALHYKGSKDTYADLPTTGNKVGDVWNVAEADAAHGVKAGDNVAWNGTTWDVLSGTVDLSGYMLTTDMEPIANSEIDTIVSG